MKSKCIVNLHVKRKNAFKINTPTYQNYLSIAHGVSDIHIYETYLTL